MSGNIRIKPGTSSWIDNDPYAPGISKNARNNILYYRRMAEATPGWVDHEKNCKVYADSRRQRRMGRSVCVDHIVPLNHPYVCGLHWHGNLQIISEKENEIKSNTWWPDMWEEQLDLFGKGVEQYALSL
jgi:hypothetical protein